MTANIELLEKVRNHFRTFPQACNMDFFQIKDSEVAKDRGAISMWDGTSCCIGGGSILLSGGKVPHQNQPQAIAIVCARLGITDKQAKDLIFFHHVGHDGEYNDLRDPLLRANIGTPEYAAVVISVIDRCIARHQVVDPIDAEANAVCASVELEIKSKASAFLAKGKVFASLVGFAVLIFAIHAAI